MKIAILGWGSLIWNPRELKLAGGRQIGGPVLSIEFSRISNDRRLTLVIDERSGVDVPTRYALSSPASLELAISDLQEREGAPNRDRIGFVNIQHHRQSPRASAQHPQTCERIRTWVKDNQMDAAIWTAIGPRFHEKAGEPFSADAAVRYLASLKEPTKALALDYIWKAPAEVVTPVRVKAEANFGLSAVAMEATSPGRSG